MYLEGTKCIRQLPQSNTEVTTSFPGSLILPHPGASEDERPWELGCRGNFKTNLFQVIFRPLPANGLEKDNHVCASFSHGYVKRL